MRDFTSMLYFEEDFPSRNIFSILSFIFFLTVFVYLWIVNMSLFLFSVEGLIEKHHS